MDALETIFFEKPLYVYLTLGIAAVALGAVWYGRRKAIWLAAASAAIVLGAGVFVVERLVMTDREQIVAALDEVAAAAQREDVPAAMGYVDREYAGWMRDKRHVRLRAEAVVKTRGIRYINFRSGPEVTITQPGQAETRFTVVVYYGKSDPPDGRVVLAWRLDWIKRSAGWRIRGADLTGSSIR